MDVTALKQRLATSTNLVIGDVKDTVTELLNEPSIDPVGFVSFDLDLYSSTKPALEVLRSAKRKTLSRVILYFDDVQLPVSHEFAGELLAIKEFNDETNDVKIDKLRTIGYGRPFHESWWLGNIYVAHDLAAIGKYCLQREADVTTFKL